MSDPFDPSLLMPATLHDYHARLAHLVGKFIEARIQLCMAWPDRLSEPVERQRRIDVARANWRLARAELERFMVDAKLRCSIEVQPHEYCTLTAGHAGPHFTTEGM